MMLKGQAKLIKFPPLVFFLILVISFIPLQGYMFFVEGEVMGKGEAAPHLKPIVIIDKEKYSRGSWMHITVKVIEEHHEQEQRLEETQHIDKQHAEEQHTEEEGHEEEKEHEHVEKEHVEEGIEGADVIVTIYDPKGNVFATMSGKTNQHGEVEFRIYIKPDALVGIYSLIPKASVEGSPILIGESVSFKVI
jgi:hypothetical protein